MADLPFQSTQFLVLFARIGGVLMLLPVFSDEGVPGRIRLLMALAMTLALYGLLRGYVPQMGSEVRLAGVILAELMTGLALGMIVRIMFLGAVIAGSVMSMQTGLTSAVTHDIALGGQVPVMARVVGVAAAVVCLALNVHHLWIGAMVHSYSMFPVGELPPAQDFAQLAVATVSRSMALGVSLAAPLLVYGIVFNVALGLTARLAPAIQVFFIAQPLNIMLGLALFATLIGAVLLQFGTAMADWMQSGWM